MKIGKKHKTVTLIIKERQIAPEAILTEAEKIGQTIDVLAVCSNHIHLAALSCNLRSLLNSNQVDVILPYEIYR